MEVLAVTCRFVTCLLLCEKSLDWTMKHLSVFTSICGVPGSHVLVIRGRWFMTSRALALLGLKELPARIGEKECLQPTWQILKYPFLGCPFYVFWGVGEGRQRVTIDSSEFMTSNLIIGFAESTLLGFGKEDFGRMFRGKSARTWPLFKLCQTFLCWAQR